MANVTAKELEKMIKLSIPKRTALGGGLYLSITNNGSTSFGFRYKIRSLDQARYEIDQWRYHYNHIRPHSSLNYLPPVAFAEQMQ